MANDSGLLTINRVDIRNRCVEQCRITWKRGVITSIEPLGPEAKSGGYLMPGFIDAHVHIESSMLVPSEFARLAVRHGTLGCVSDPHEIANVLGEEGVRFMLDNAEQTPFHILFGVPSCVPATPFETAGAELDAAAVERLLDDPRLGYLSEMMNFPGVLNGDDQVLAKLEAAKRRGLPIDGHAPGLKGERAKRYVAAGISTDHECGSIEEARDKIAYGMKILIREGSAARNFNALHPLISESPGQVMLCSDDKHPDDLVEGHINQLAAHAVALGHDVFDVLQCACINPVDHYGLPLGQLRVGDAMDAIMVDDLKTFRVQKSWLAGELVAEAGNSLLPQTEVTPINRFEARPITAEQLRLPPSSGAIRVIEAADGELLTGEALLLPKRIDQRPVPDVEQDVLQLVVYNRYGPAEPVCAFIRNFGLTRGAIASSVAHDSHNIVAVGAEQQALADAINAVVTTQGGIAVVDGERVETLPLPVAGIMSPENGDQIAVDYARLDLMAKGMGSTLCAPFMSLSFMALLVIPALKLSDKGLFDGRSFQFTGLSA